MGKQRAVIREGKEKNTEERGKSNITVRIAVKGNSNYIINYLPKMCIIHISLFYIYMCLCVKTFHICIKRSVQI